MTFYDFINVDFERTNRVQWHNCIVPAVGRHKMILKVKRSRPKRAAILLRNFALFLFFLLALIRVSTLTAFCEEDKTWSFDFKNKSISEALDELCQTTGIEIISNQLPQDRVVTKNYTDETIDEIVKDLFKGLNFALVWNHADEGKDTVQVWILQNGSGKSTSLPRINVPAPPTRAFGHGRKTAPPVKKQEDTEETEEPEENVDDSLSQPFESEKEGEMEDVGSDDNADSESPADSENEPEEESDEETEGATSAIPIKTPNFE